MSAQDYVLQIVGLQSKLLPQETVNRPIPISAACRTVSGDAVMTNYQTGRRLPRERSIPPMHAANPAPAIEHATVGIGCSLHGYTWIFLYYLPPTSA